MPKSLQNSHHLRASSSDYQGCLPLPSSCGEVYRHELSTPHKRQVDTHMLKFFFNLQKLIQKAINLKEKMFLQTTQRRVEGETRPRIFCSDFTWSMWPLQQVELLKRLVYQKVENL